MHMPSMGMMGLLLFGLSGAILFFGLVFVVQPNAGWQIGVVLGFVGFLGIGAGLDDIIRSARKEKKEG